MSDQYFRERMNTPANVETADQNKNEAVGKPTSLTDSAPANAPATNEVLADDAFISKTPMDESLVDGSQTNKSSAYKSPVPTVEKATQEAPMSREESDQFHTRWNEIQARFVDEPREAVHQADGLVSEVVEKITRAFASERSSLEGQWKHDNDVSTEDLRKALQHYHSFFNRLVV